MRVPVGFVGFGYPLPSISRLQAAASSLRVESNVRGEREKGDRGKELLYFCMPLLAARACSAAEAIQDGPAH